MNFKRLNKEILDLCTKGTSLDDIPGHISKPAAIVKGQIEFLLEQGKIKRNQYTKEQTKAFDEIEKVLKLTLAVDSANKIENIINNVGVKFHTPLFDKKIQDIVQPKINKIDSDAITNNTWTAEQVSWLDAIVKVAKLGDAVFKQIEKQISKFVDLLNDDGVQGIDKCIELVEKITLDNAINGKTKGDEAFKTVVVSLLETYRASYGTKISLGKTSAGDLIKEPQIKILGKIWANAKENGASIEDFEQSTYKMQIDTAFSLTPLNLSAIKILLEAFKDVGGICTDLTTHTATITTEIPNIIKGSSEEQVTLLEEVAILFELSGEVYKQIEKEALEAAGKFDLDAVKAFVLMAKNVTKVEMTIGTIGTSTATDGKIALNLAIVAKMTQYQTECKNLTSDGTNLDAAADIYEEAGNGTKEQFKKDIVDAVIMKISDTDLFDSAEAISAVSLLSGTDIQAKMSELKDGYITSPDGVTEAQINNIDVVNTKAGGSNLKQDMQTEILNTKIFDAIKGSTKDIKGPLLKQVTLFKNAGGEQTEIQSKMLDLVKVLAQSPAGITTVYIDNIKAVSKDAQFDTKAQEVVKVCVGSSNCTASGDLDSFYKLLGGTVADLHPSGDDDRCSGGGTITKKFIHISDDANKHCVEFKNIIEQACEGDKWRSLKNESGETFSGEIDCMNDLLVLPDYCYTKYDPSAKETKCLKVEQEICDSNNKVLGETMKAVVNDNFCTT